MVFPWYKVLIHFYFLPLPQKVTKRSSAGKIRLPTLSLLLKFLKLNSAKSGASNTQKFMRSFVLWGPAKSFKARKWCFGLGILSGALIFHSVWIYGFRDYGKRFKHC